jgi:hypothetical protein
MLLDSNILIYAAQEQTPQIEAMVTSAENAVASVVEIEVYGFPGLKVAALRLRAGIVIRFTIRIFSRRVAERAEKGKRNA